MHAMMGISGEVGELLDAVKKHVFYKKPLDIEHIIEELGDIEFYMEAFRQCLDIDRRECLQANIDKLLTRYPSGSFSNEDAIARADKVHEDADDDYDADDPRYAEQGDGNE